MKEKIDDLSLLTQQERHELLSQLLQLHVGVVRLVGNYNWCLPIFGKVPAESTVMLSACPHMDFTPRKLIILESSTPVTITNNTFRDHEYVTGPWWKRENKVLRVCDNQTMHMRMEQIPRGSWTIRGVFVGNNFQFPAGDINGGAFCPDNELRFRDRCFGSVYITVNVHNNMKADAEFFAVVLGERSV